MKRAVKFDARKVTGIALFVALEVALCFITNYVQFGAVNMNLALFPIVIGACFYGPWVGLALGLINGVITILAPTTLAFISLSPAATVFVCLFKTSLAGFLAGLFHKLIAKKSDLVGALVAAITVPVVNTGIFIIGSFIFFADLFKDAAGDTNLFVFLVTAFIGVNFLIEIIGNLVIDPVIYKSVRHLTPRFKRENNKKKEDTDPEQTTGPVNDASEVEVVYDPDKE